MVRAFYALVRAVYDRIVSFGNPYSMPILTQDVQGESYVKEYSGC